MPPIPSPHSEPGSGLKRLLPWETEAMGEPATGQCSRTLSTCKNGEHLRQVHRSYWVCAGCQALKKGPMLATEEERMAKEMAGGSPSLWELQKGQGEGNHIVCSPIWGNPSSSPPGGKGSKRVSRWKWTHPVRLVDSQGSSLYVKCLKYLKALYECLVEEWCHPQLCLRTIVQEEMAIFKGMALKLWPPKQQSTTPKDKRFRQWCLCIYSVESPNEWLLIHSSC